MVSIHLSAHSRTWWSLVVRGIAAVAFGIIAIANPGGTTNFVIRLLGILVLVAGIVGVLAAMRHRDQSKKWDLLMVPTVIAVVLGLILILVPGAVASFFIFLIGLAAFIYGIWEIYQAMRLRKQLAGEWMPFLVAIVAIIIGIVLMAKRGAIAAATMWLLGVFALVLGVLWIMLGLRARGWMKSADVPPQTPTEKPTDKPV
jgi:uncharacterized membrane protein HdeD (DUF308 family)